MKKIGLIFPLMLVVACTQTEPNEFADMDYDEPGTETAIGSGQNPYEMPADDAAAARATGQNPIYTARDAMSARPANTQPSLAADGTVIEIPAQQIYIGDVAGNQVPAPANGMVPATQPAPVYPPVATVTVPAIPVNALSYSQPVYYAVPDQAYPTGPVMITLQYAGYPGAQTVQCLSTDTACLFSYESQGFMRVQDKPSFAGYKDTLSHSDYPAGGRWRDNNNIPRW